MPNTVSYNYVPNQAVYVINTLGPNNEYPYWGFPYGNYGNWGAGYPYDNSGPIGYPGNYPNGFTSTTPAIQSGVVLQTRILFTTNNPTVPTIMYDVRVTGELGTSAFPQNMVFPATPGTAGQQTVDFGGTLTPTTPINIAEVGTPSIVTASYTTPVTGATTVTKPSAQYTAAVTVNSTLINLSIDLSTTPTIANVITAINTQLGSLASASIVNGAIVVQTTQIGSTTSLSIVDTNSPTNLFGNLQSNFIGFTNTQGTSQIYRTHIFVNGTPIVVSLDLATVPNFGSLAALMNIQLGTSATISIVGGNLQIASNLLGTTSTIYVSEPSTPGLIESLPGYIGFFAPTTGTASGLDQAQAYYATLNL